MNTQLLYPQNPAFQPEWAHEDIRLTFFKCIRWQVEETLDPSSCPYHYYCDSTYPGDYPPHVDVLVLLFISASYLATLVIMVIDITRRGRTYLSQSKRLLLPCGPVSLPVMLLALAKGHRINTVFPLSSVGPALLLLLHVSALTFDNGVDKDARYALFEASAISGILHASLYLDAVILPYYTGFDALVSSRFSGECQSCVCRDDVMVVGGRLVTYRGWSATTFVVVVALLLRIICRMRGENKGRIIPVKSLLECLGWILITMDCIYLIRTVPADRSMMHIPAFGCIIVLICLHVIKKASARMVRWESVHEKSDRQDMHCITGRGRTLPLERV